MRHVVRVGFVAASVAALLGVAVVGSVAQDKEAIIKERRATMKRQGEAIKAVSAYAKGEGDQAAALSGINELLAINPKIVGLFPAGSTEAEFPGKTNAKPDIWKDHDKFQSIPPALKAEEEKILAAVKAGDKKAVGEGVAAAGKNGCGACHTQFREKLS
jgi:cytochrome c556